MGNLVSITRANFLPLTIVIVLAGLGAAFYSHRGFLPIDAALVMVGALLTHASVNAFNNYFDYRSKIDAKTPKTPFSGGVDILVKGVMKPSEALTVCLFTIICAALIGVYFLVRLFNVLFPLIVYGAIIIVLYTPILSCGARPKRNCRWLWLRTHGLRSLRYADRLNRRRRHRHTNPNNNSRRVAPLSQRVPGRGSRQGWGQAPYRNTVGKTRLSMAIRNRPGSNLRFNHSGCRYRCCALPGASFAHEPTHSIQSRPTYFEKLQPNTRPNPSAGVKRPFHSLNNNPNGMWLCSSFARLTCGF